MITAHALTKSFGTTTAVDGIDFTVEPGRVTGFLGPNGAGKSTTMRMILGLDRPTRRQRHRQRPPVRRLGRAAARGRRAARGPGDPPRPLRPRPPALAGREQRHPDRPRRRGARPGRARRRSPASASASSPSAWASGSASPSRCSATRRSSSSTSRSTGSTRGHPLGPHPARQLAAEGRTVFVSSHLMSRDGADRRPPDRHRARPAPRRLLDGRVHRRARHVVRPGARPQRRRGRRPARRPGLDVDRHHRRRAARDRPGRRRRRRAGRRRAGWCCTS